MSTASMSIARAREILENVERDHENELKTLRQQVSKQEEIAKSLQKDLNDANEKTKKMRENYDRVSRELNKREVTLVEERSENQVKIATLEAEKQMLAERDKEARNELTRLMNLR